MRDEGWSGANDGWSGADGGAEVDEGGRTGDCTMGWTTRGRTAGNMGQTVGNGHGCREPWGRQGGQMSASEFFLH